MNLGRRGERAWPFPVFGEEEGDKDKDNPNHHKNPFPFPFQFQFLFLFLLLNSLNWDEVDDFAIGRGGEGREGRMINGTIYDLILIKSGIAADEKSNLLNCFNWLNNEKFSACPVHVQFQQNLTK
jgi:hypothetical protein